MNEVIYDSRFQFKYDTPFEGDINKEYLLKLKNYFSNNQDKFTEIDWCADSRYLILRPDLTTLFNANIENGTENNKLTKHIKSFLNNITGISKDLKEWCNEPVDVPADNIPSKIDNNNNDYDSDNDTGNNVSTNFEPTIIPAPLPMKFSHNLAVGMHYDISNDKCLSYEDVCKLCINIARTKMVENNIPKDETIEQLEKEKRKKLTQEIIRYKNNKLIDPLVEDDLSAMSLEQLETCLEQCIQYQENFKTLELFKRTFSAGGTIYDAVFPEGIPLGKDKKLCFKGIGKEILSTLFNATTTTGIAFQNILRKNNIRVSDELLTLVAFAEICISKVEIKKILPNGETTNNILAKPQSLTNAKQIKSTDQYIDVSD